MWRNYLTVAIRSLTKNRIYSAINIVGLAVGMAACLIILLYVRHERSYDAWLPDANDVYQAQTYYKDPQIGFLQNAAYAVKASLSKDFPQIDAAVFLSGPGGRVIRNGIAYEVPDAYFADSDPFAVLQFPLVRGDPRTALKDVDTAVLSESEAKRWFGDSDPLGKTLTMPWKKGTKDYRITGVMRDLPQNSHMKIGMLLRWNIEAAFEDVKMMLTNYGANSGLLYVRLKPGSDVNVITAALPAWERRNIPDTNFGDKTINMGDWMDIHLANIRDVHLSPTKSWSGKPSNSSQTVNTFAVIALMILAIGCVNFVNLATARASQRAREVALRKVLGANRTQLVIQFIGESLLMASLAMLLGLAIAELSMPMITAFLDVDMRLVYFGTDGMALPILLLILIVGAAGGIYPGIYLSRFQPARVLKANKSAADAQGSGRLRSALVIGQFAVSIGLIICSAVIYGQTVFARTADPGYERDRLIQIPSIGSVEYLHGSSAALKQEIGNIDGVRAVGAGNIGVGGTNMNNTTVSIPGRKLDTIPFGDYQVDADFFRTMGIKLVAGRLFDSSHGMDDVSIPFPVQPEAMRALTSRGMNVVVNELAAKVMGFDNPKSAVGKQITVGWHPDYGGKISATIIGVVQDSRFRSMREPIDPIIFSYNSRFQNDMVVRYSGSPSSVRERIEQVWKRFAPDVPFKAEFSEDIVAKQYQAEESRATVFATFSVLAVLIGCLGLFGLASFTTERRTKEIGIRKVLGASTPRIVRLLVWQFSYPVLIANLIAWPVAWWLMRDWLNSFNARIELTPVPFVVAGLVALIIAIATIAAHAIRVARTNPVHALRYE